MTPCPCDEKRHRERVYNGVRYWRCEGCGKLTPMDPDACRDDAEAREIRDESLRQLGRSVLRSIGAMP